MVRGEFVKADRLAILYPVYVVENRCEQCGSALNPHAKIEASPLSPVRHPAQELRIANALLGFGNGAASNAVEHQLVPDLLSFGQLFVFPTPFTSPIA